MYIYLRTAVLFSISIGILNNVGHIWMRGSSIKSALSVLSRQLDSRSNRTRV